MDNHNIPESRSIIITHTSSHVKGKFIKKEDRYLRINLGGKIHPKLGMIEVRYRGY